MSERFTPHGDGLRMRLTEPERELLRNLPGDLRAVYEDQTGTDEARARIFPRAYLDPTEEGAEEEWQELVHPELLRDRLDALGRVVAVLDAASERRGGALEVDLVPDDIPALLGVINDARLALGTRLSVTDDTDLDDLDADDPMAPMHVAYAWLTQLEGDFVEALLGGMPDMPE